MELNALQDSFERVAKRQKLCSSKCEELIDQIAHEIEQALTCIQSDNNLSVPVDQRTVLTDLKAKLQKVISDKNLQAPQRELIIILTKHQKLLEKILHPDISKALRNIDFNPHIINQIIITYFYREGLFDIVEYFKKEADEPEAISLRLQFQEIHEILEAVKSRNIKPALNWVSENKVSLKESKSDLEMKLHKLHFVDLLQNGTRAEALQYAKISFAPLASRHMNEIQKLMCSLLWAGKLEKSPYADLLNPTHWEKLSEELLWTFCNFAGQSFTDPLSVAVAAGAQGLPTLLKLANVMAANKHEWQEMKQLPVSIDLGKEFQFHSIFVCPVSWDQGTEENPPMMLPCQHVLCKQSVYKLSKGNTRNFKCPYCPVDASVAQCKRLYF